MNGHKLKVIDRSTYLGSTLSRAVHIDDEVTARIANASVVFGRKRNGINPDTKLKVYKAMVLSTLLCVCEFWTVYTNVMFSVKSQVARQDSRHSGPEEGMNAKYAYCLKASTAKMVSRGIFRPNVGNCPGFPPPLDSRRLRSTIA